MINKISNIIDLIITFYIGILGTFFRKQFIEFCARGFEFLYNHTGFFVFKLQAEGMKKPYMRIFVPFVASFFFLIGMVAFIYNVWSN